MKKKNGLRLQYFTQHLTQFVNMMYTSWSKMHADREPCHMPNAKCQKAQTPLSLEISSCFLYCKEFFFFPKVKGYLQTDVSQITKKKNNNPHIYLF